MLDFQVKQTASLRLVSAFLFGAALTCALPGPLQAQSAEQHARDMNDIAATPP